MNSVRRAPVFYFSNRGFRIAAMIALVGMLCAPKFLWSDTSRLVPASQPQPEGPSDRSLLIFRAASAGAVGYSAASVMSSALSQINPQSASTVIQIAALSAASAGVALLARLMVAPARRVMRASKITAREFHGLQSVSRLALGLSLGFAGASGALLANGVAQVDAVSNGLLGVGIVTGVFAGFAAKEAVGVSSALSRQRQRQGSRRNGSRWGRRRSGPKPRG